MKILLRILVFIIIFTICYPGAPQDSDAEEKSTSTQVKADTREIEKIPDNVMGTEEEYPSYYDSDIFLRKLNRQKLPALSRKEKITWAFRLVEKDPFL
jgi:hypothetical protein